MTPKPTETLTDYALNKEVTDRELLLRIAISADRTTEAVEAINERLSRGDVEIGRLKTTVFAKNSNWKKSPIMWSSGIASALIGIIEIFKHYFSTKG